MKAIFSMSLKDDFGWAGYLKTVALGFPLVLVLLAAAFAATPREYRPVAISNMLLGYPVRIDLLEVEKATLRRDMAIREAEAEAASSRLLSDGDASSLVVSADASAAGEAAENEDSAPALGEDSSSALAMFPQSDRREQSGGAADDQFLLPIDFDLAGGPEADSTLRVQMEVQSGQQILGPIQVHIDSTSSIYVSRAEMMNILPTYSSAIARLDGDFVRLSRLRDVGVDLRYDATADRLIVSEGAVRRNARD
ncbi:hypothetical protein GCM10009127_26250 [Alteraurantiacibacter aestuarii]|uniref:hypothetical protein n=1 Tax=Alteraurantiacibacter aestuarii TaxID=650004 RepID=UPI0031DEEA40